jgi:hypothetical protein
MKVYCVGWDDIDDFWVLEDVFSTEEKALSFVKEFGKDYYVVKEWEVK